MIDLRVGRVHVFLLHALGPSVQQSSAKRHHLPAHIQPREDHASRIAVIETLFVFDAKARLLQKLRLIACLLRRLGQRIFLRQGKTQTELLHDIIPDASTTEILLTDGDAVRIILQYLLEIGLRPFVHDKHRLAVALLLSFLVGQFLFLYLDIIFLRQPAQSLGIGDLLVLHQEVNGRTTLSTGKTLTDLLRGRHHKRRRRIVMKRTQALVVHPRLPQRDELPHHVNNVRGVHNLINSCLIYHNQF